MSEKKRKRDLNREVNVCDALRAREMNVCGRVRRRKHKRERERERERES